MADILNIGSSALLSLQAALNTTGHNIANANTDGYSRQRVNFDTLPPQLSGSGYIGAGVNVDSIERSYDQFLTTEVRSRTSSASGLQAFHQLASRMDGLLADPATGLGPSIETFFGALQDVANNPGSLPERQVMLGQAQSLADRFHYLDDSFQGLNDEVNARINGSVSQINALAKSIAQLNEQVVSASAAAGGQPPNDLLDARDQLITRLAEKIGVNTVAQSDGAINVMIGKGQSLVIGSGTQQLQAYSDPLDGSRLLVGIAGIAGETTDLGPYLKGGELGAALNFRDQVLASATGQLGLVATGLADTFNAQHRGGMDLNGDLGGDFFRPLEPAVTGSTLNTGTAAVSATIDNVGALSAHSYRLQYDGSDWNLTNLDNGSTSAGAGPFVVDGLTIAVGGTPAAGDSFRIEPTSQAAALFAVAIREPAAIAAAAPLRGQAPLSNLGTGGISQPVVDDAAGLPLAGSVSLTFNPDALGAGVPGFDVSGIAGGPLAYDPAVQSGGLAVSLAGFSFELSGEPEAGDELVIANNTGGSGDNRNALSLAGLQVARLLEDGSASYQDAYGSMVADVAVQTSQAESSAATEGVLMQQAVSARDSVSGVNLDEEAANLIRYQQAYQAAAQVIAVADQVFQALINATRR